MHDQTTATPTPDSRRRLRRAVLAIGALAAIATAVGVWLFFRGDAPDEVSLDSAIETVTEDADLDDAGSGADSNTGATAAETDSTPDAATISGEWTIDTETGEFDYESATGSFAGFRIEEELRTIGSTTAVGRTGDISGSMTIDGTTVTAAAFEVDLTTITTNSEMRDDNVQEALESETFPTAGFSLTQPIELGAEAATGSSISVTAIGDMTIHGVTQPVEFTIDAQLLDDVVVAVGSTTMTFSDFGVDVPDGGPVISVDDFGVVEFQFLLRR